MHPTEKLEEFLGMSETEAMEMAARYHISLRVLAKEGISFIRDKRHNPYRVSIHIKDGKVIKATYG